MNWTSTFDNESPQSRGAVMIPLSELEKAVREGLAYLKAQEDVEEGEVLLPALTRRMIENPSHSRWG